MDEYTRHQKIWRVLYALSNRWVCRKFNLTHEDLHVEGPVLLIPNHVSAWDPLLVAMSLKDKQAYFVASEHIFRLGFVTKLLGWALGPIARRKGSSGADTVKACLRHLRAGHSICLFAEGEASWDGLPHPIFPATGKLVKSSGATLVTYRLEGGYLSVPRWAWTRRRGRVHGHPVGIYPPEQLKSMTPAEINEIISRDLNEDAWARQRENPVPYRGKRRAEGLERMLYLCPRCRRIGTLHTKDDWLYCDCGLSVRYTETGFLDPAEPFETLAEWNAWQKETLKDVEKAPDKLLFSDDELLLSRVSLDHGVEKLGRGTLEQYGDRLCFAGRVFPMAEIGNMAMVKANILLMSVGETYYEIRSNKGANLLKYLDLWKER